MDRWMDFFGNADSPYMERLDWHHMWKDLTHLCGGMQLRFMVPYHWTTIPPLPKALQRLMRRL